jgi:AraC-like DNA-binding protein
MKMLRDLPAGSGAGVAAEVMAIQADWPAHGHAFMELVLVKSGSGLHRTQQGASRIGAGAVRIVRPGQWHKYDEPKDLVVWNLYIAPKTLASELTALRAHPQVTSLLTGRLAASASSDIDIEVIEPHLLALNSPPAASAGNELARFGHLLVVLGHIAQAPDVVEREEQARLVHPTVSAATDLMHTYPALRWTLGELARRVHTSEHYLCRCFARELGISPMSYLDRYRLEIVAHFLLESALSVAAIAARVGIDDPSYLARRFRAAHGMTPSKYRSTLSGVTHAKLP